MEKYKKRLVNIDILSRSIKEVYEEVQSNKNDKNEIKYVFKVNSLIKANFIEKLVEIIITVTIKIKLDSGSEKECGGIKVCYAFIVDYDDKFLIDKEYDKELLTDLNNVAISTTRGIIWDSFRGTSLHRAILPLAATTISEDEE